MTTERPLVSIVAPAFNEAELLERNIARLLAYCDGLESQYRWELIIVNDGSSDNTAEVAERLAERDPRIVVLHHPRNRGAGKALSTGIAASRGDYVVTLDIDLSYSPEHVERLLTALREKDAQLVLASPYMEGGELTNVPWLRRVMSVWANRFLRAISHHGKLSTITSMVRAYEGPYIRALALRSTGLAIMPETVYKTMILRGRIEQIPAHLDWSAQVAKGIKRRSSMRIVRQIISTILAGFIFRPFMFFVLPGLLLLGFAAWVNFWMIVHFVEALNAPEVAASPGRVSLAVAVAYREYPHTFIVGLLSLMLSIQLISLGILALQSKNYFEEIFHLGSSLRRQNLDRRQGDDAD
jgi:glycosyltransferase involved in cell wall biosynthesis